ncbi:MAG TPA: transposase [Streptosporangiaceae bacterium]|nr:transposase [Streptosporangiaceae bacterium]
MADLCAKLFTPLPRSDQRRKGREYLSGLLMARGRKSMRNIAAVVGGPAAEQSLHHFISNSTWCWRSVRRALTEFVVQSAPPQAWVVRPMVIPKSGEHSVGVDRCFVPATGTIQTAQRAVGVWATSEEAGIPVEWRLHLPPGWLDDTPRRNRASVPEEATEETLGDCLVEVYLEMAGRGRLPRRPVVLDARGNDIRSIVAKLRAAKVPMLVRIAGTEELIVADPALHGHRATTQPAREIIKATKATRRGVLVPGPHDAVRMRLVSSARVQVPRGTGPARGAMRLLGAGRSDIWPAEFWLTNMTEAPASALLRLAALLERVDQDFEIATSVGIRDFAGRSYEGWHRHVTLASAAHAVVALTD